MQIPLSGPSVKNGPGPPIRSSSEFIYEARYGVMSSGEASNPDKTIGDHPPALSDVIAALLSVSVGFNDCRTRIAPDCIVTILKQFCICVAYNSTSRGD